MSSLWTDRRSARYFKKHYGEINKSAKKIRYGNNPGKVLAGPFKDKAYITSTGKGSLASKWIGVYESELSHVVDEIIQKSPSVIIDVGSAESYYGVEFARTLPRAHIYAFDSSPRGRRILRQMMHLNACTNITVGGLCDHRRLNATIARSPTALVVGDTEGAALQLLDPVNAPAIVHADILVECHRIGDESPFHTAEHLMSRFEASHLVEQINSRDLDISKLGTLHPSLASSAPDGLHTITNEGRGEPQCWLWMRVKSKHLGEAVSAKTS